MTTEQYVLATPIIKELAELTKEYKELGLAIDVLVDADEACIVPVRDSINGKSFGFEAFEIVDFYKARYNRLGFAIKSREQQLENIK